MSPTTLVREETTEYTVHDQLFKVLINTFFEEFLEAFFPEVHQEIDFISVQPLPAEVFTDVPKGKTRRLDIVMETTLKDTETLLVIHIEPQSYYQTDFNERMYHYFSLLYNKYRKPILPIAVFSYEENRHEENQFSIGFPFFHVFTFNFLMLELKKENNWRKYLKSNNPAAAALLSKMGYTEEERVEVRKEFLRMITKMELDPAKQRIISIFFETYLQVSNQEEEELMGELKYMDKSDEEFIKNLTFSWEEKGIEKGVKKEKRKIALEMLDKGLSIELIAEITHLQLQEVEDMKKD